MRKILVPIAHFESCQTALELGGKLSDKYNASLTVLHTFSAPSQSHLGSGLASTKLAEWGIEPPQFKLLDQAQESLKNQDILKLDQHGNVEEKHSPKAVVDGVFEVHLFGKHDQDIRLRLRNGKPVQEIMSETEDPRYDLIITGTRGHKGLKKLLVGSIAQEVALRSPCSMLVAKNLKPDQDVIVGVTGRETALEAVRQAALLTSALGTSLKLLAIISEESERTQSEQNLKAARDVITDSSLKIEDLIVHGDPVDVLLEQAGTEHILVLGRAPRSRVKELFLGDLSLKILDQSECPVLITSYARPLESEESE